MHGCRLPREQRAPQPPAVSGPCGGVRPVPAGMGTAMGTPPRAHRVRHRRARSRARSSSPGHSGAGGTAAVTSPESAAPSQTVPAAVSIPCAKPLWKTTPSFKNETPMEPTVSPSWAWARVYSQPSSRPWLTFVCTLCYRGPEPWSRMENQTLLQNLQQLFYSAFCLLV